VNATKTVLSYAARELKNNIDDYFLLASVPQQNKIQEFRDKIKDIEEDESRLILENWFENMIKD
jgi:hypothetical protein